MCNPNDDFLVVGAGSHAQRIAEAIRANAGTILGFATTDRTPAEIVADTTACPIMNLDQALERFPDAALVVAIGALEVRSVIVESIRRLGRRLPPIIHPRAIISPNAELAEGVVILPAAVVEWRAKVGRGAIIDTNAVICHEAQIGAMSHIQSGTIVGPRAQVSAGTKTRIGDRILEVGGPEANR